MIKVIPGSAILLILDLNKSNNTEIYINIVVTNSLIINNIPLYIHMKVYIIILLAL